MYGHGHETNEPDGLTTHPPPTPHTQGCGMVVLKRLSRAVADGDRVYAVIRGSAVNHDGKTTSLTAPNPLAQEAVLRAAYRDAKISPSQVCMCVFRCFGWVWGG